jgi:hypothetical protein
MAGEYIESGEVVKPSCLIRLKKIGRLMSVGFGRVAGTLGRGGEGRNSCKGRQEFSSCGDGIGGDYASNRALIARVFMDCRSGERQPGGGGFYLGFRINNLRGWLGRAQERTRRELAFCRYLHG